MNDATATSSRQLLTPVQSKLLIDEYLTNRLQQRVESARDIDPAYAQLWTTTAELFQAGGKRFRPYMTLLTSQALGAHDVSAFIPVAAAQELLHLGTLVHDDVIDRDLIRYGVNNVNGTYENLYQTFIEDETDRRHYSNSAAILAGDLLLSEAYYLTNEADIIPETRRDVQSLIHGALFNVIGGELLDTEAAFKKLAGAHPSTIAEYKTASYSFISPFLIGATLANAPEAQKAVLRKLGLTLGIAYQVRDDVIGIFGDESKTGKSADGDIKEGKRTYLSDELLRRASDEQRTEFESHYGDHRVTDEHIARVRELLIETGTLEAVEARISEYESEAYDLIESLGIDETGQQALGNLVAICLRREK